MVLSPETVREQQGPNELMDPSKLLDRFIIGVTKIPFVQAVLCTANPDQKTGVIYTIVGDDAPDADSPDPCVLRLRELQEELTEGLSPLGCRDVHAVRSDELRHLLPVLAAQGVKTYSPITIEHN